MSFDPTSVQEFVRIGALILGVIIAWGVLKLIFRLAKRIFDFGCGAIILVGILLIALRFLR